MATRDSVDHFLQTCEDVILKVQEQYEEGSLQGHYHDVEYHEAMQELENLYNKWLQIYNSANPQQREQLHRKRLQIQDMQNKMILLNHDR
ncbi:MAG: YtzC family protein [Bacillales bacterium]|nr:YtzC family protein [Bacillales bacterium]